MIAALVVNLSVHVNRGDERDAGTSKNDHLLVSSQPDHKLDHFTTVLVVK